MLDAYALWSVYRLPFMPFFFMFDAFLYKGMSSVQQSWLLDDECLWVDIPNTIKREQIYAWCDAHVGFPDYAFGLYRLHLRRARDAVHFKLSWSDRLLKTKTS